VNESTIPYATPEKGAIAGRDVFGVIVRTVGLLLTLWGVYVAVYLGVVQAFNAPTADQPKESLAAFAVLWIVLGIALVRGEWLVRFAYGPPHT
jgi:hypothetical protein